MGHGTILVSGFGPWGTLPSNPTLAILDRLAASPFAGRLRTLALPVDAAGIEDAVARALDEHAPDLWLGLGLALGAAVVAVERIAVNVMDFAGPDIAGARPGGLPVVPGGPAAYLSTLPVAPIVARLRAAGIPARLSPSAGTFLCNQLMYAVLHRVALSGRAVRAGFLHLPADPALVAGFTGKDADMPSMSLDLSTRAVILAIEQSMGIAASATAA